MNVFVVAMDGADDADRPLETEVHFASLVTAAIRCTKVYESQIFLQDNNATEREKVKSI